jgi:hypothetical protein
LAIYELATSPPTGDIRMSRAAELVCFALCVAHIAYLAASLFDGSWLPLSGSNGPVSDFVNVWSAGRLVLDGAPAAAYDWAVHRQVEVAAVGHSP